MTLFPSIFSASKNLSNDPCDKCKSRNDDKWREKQFLNAQNLSRRQKAIVSKNVVTCLCTIALLGLFLLVLIRFLYPSGILGVKDPDLEYIFTSSLNVSPNSDSSDDDPLYKTSDPPQFVVSPVNICVEGDTDGIQLLILVMSFISNFHRRQATRVTWEALTENRGPHRLGFIVGTTMNFTASLLLQEESEKYLDIIQGDFEDTSPNITLKSISALKWVAECCPHAQFFLKADDDIYITFKFLLKILNSKAYLPYQDFINEFMQSENSSDEYVREKYSVSDKDYSDDVYPPPYISKSVYFTKRNPVQILYEATIEVRPIVTNVDVVITGHRQYGINDGVLTEDEQPHSAQLDSTHQDIALNPTHQDIAADTAPQLDENDQIEKVWQEMIKTLLRIQDGGSENDNSFLLHNLLPGTDEKLSDK